MIPNKRTPESLRGRWLLCGPKLREWPIELRAARQTARVKLSVLPSFARLWLMPRLAILQGEPADIVLQVSPEHRQARLDGREADLAIRHGRGTWPGVDAHELLRERLFAVATPKIAKTLRAGESADVLRQTLLHDTDTKQWRLWCQHAGIAYRPRGGEHRFEDYDLLLAAAESGVGIAIARWPLAAASLQSDRLVRIAGPEVASPNAHYVVTRPGETRVAVLRVVERLAAEAAQPNV